MSLIGRKDFGQPVISQWLLVGLGLGWFGIVSGVLLSNNPKPPGSKPTIHHLADWIQHFPTAFFFCLKPEKKIRA